MAETNWATEENGARIADVSFEGSSGVNCAANLLHARENELWLAESAPQHVTLALSALHPPLQYAGWYVRSDSPTNPKVVEIASGPSADQLQPLLVCEALPGAGTQVWKLPRAILAGHTFVRFTIRESFGPGPTYMNSLMLLESDPGPHYNVNGESPPTTSVSLGAAGPQYSAPVAATSLTCTCLSSPSQNMRSLAERSPLPRGATPPAGINTSATSRGDRSPDDGGRSDVGMFIKSSPKHTLSPTTVATAGVHCKDGKGNDPLQPSGPADRGRSSQARLSCVRSNSRMSQLLRDLDDDIKLLKPIKTLSPGKKVLTYLSQEDSGLQVGSLDEEPTPDRRHHRHRHHHSSNSSNSGSGDSDDGRHCRHEERRQSHEPRSQQRRGGQNGADSADDDSNSRWGGAPHPRSCCSATAGFGGFHADPRLHPTQMGIALHPPFGTPGAQPQLTVNSNYEARLNALERAVAALNEAVRHQRDDLTLMKRLLLQQALERRKEAEQRFEEKQRYERVFNAANGLVVVPAPTAPSPPAAANPPAPSAQMTTTTTAAAASPGFVPDARLTHRSITVDFPEDALRVFVESLLEQRLRKYTKKVEAKLLQRLDKQLHAVVKVFSATAEGQLSNASHAAAATATGSAPVAATMASMSTPPSLYASNAGGCAFSPVSQSLLVQRTPERGISDKYRNTSNNTNNGHATPHRSGFASSTSSKGDVSCTSRSRKGTGIDAFHPCA